MSELENIENSQEVETIPTDNTTNDLHENIEQSTGEVSGEVSGEVPEDNSAEIEAEQERLRREHEEYLNSFPDTTVFYRDLLVNGNVKSLGNPTKNPHVAEQWGFLDNHFDESELTYIGTPECGIWYLKGYEPVIDPEEEKKIAFNQKIAQIKNAVQKLIDDTAASRDYDDGFTCVSYFNSTDETFKAEARAFNYWRDQLWRKCYEILDDVLAGKIDSEQVNVDYVLNLLPEIEW